MPKIKTKVSPKTVKKHRGIRTNPSLFVPAFVLMIAAIILSSIGTNSYREANASKFMQGDSYSEAVDAGLVINLNFKNPSDFLDEKNSQKIINQVNHKDAGVLGLDDKDDKQDPVYNAEGYYTFNGKDQLIKIDNSYAPKFDFTYEVWLRSSAADQTSYIISSDDSAKEKSTVGLKIQDGYWWSMGFNNENKVYIPYPDKTVDTKWHHLAITRQGSTLTIYLDGKPAEVTRNINQFLLSNDFLTIGAGHSQDNYTDYFKGDVAELRIYARSLTVDEIHNNMLKSRPDFLK